MRVVALVVGLFLFACSSPVEGEDDADRAGDSAQDEDALRTTTRATSLFGRVTSVRIDGSAAVTGARVDEVIAAMNLAAPAPRAPATFGGFGASECDALHEVAFFGARSVDLGVAYVCAVASGTSRASLQTAALPTAKHLAPAVDVARLVAVLPAFRSLASYMPSVAGLAWASIGHASRETVDVAASDARTLLGSAITATEVPDRNGLVHCEAADTALTLTWSDDATGAGKTASISFCARAAARTRDTGYFDDGRGHFGAIAFDAAAATTLWF